MHEAAELSAIEVCVRRGGSAVETGPPRCCDLVSVKRAIKTMARAIVAFDEDA